MERLSAAHHKVGVNRSLHHFVVERMMVFSIFSNQDIDQLYLQSGFSSFIWIFEFFWEKKKVKGYLLLCFKGGMNPMISVDGLGRQKNEIDVNHVLDSIYIRACLDGPTDGFIFGPSHSKQTFSDSLFPLQVLADFEIIFLENFVVTWKCNRKRKLKLI